MKELSPEAAELRDLLEDTMGQLRLNAKLIAMGVGLAHTTILGFLNSDFEPRKSTRARIKAYCEQLRKTARPKDAPQSFDRLPLSPGVYSERPGQNTRNWKRAR